MGNSPTHEEIEADFYVPFNGTLLTHLGNSVNEKYTPSGHAMLRNILIEILQSENARPYNIESLKPELLSELKEFLSDYNVSFDFSKYQLLKPEEFLETNEETKKKVVNRKTLSYFLVK